MGRTGKKHGVHRQRAELLIRQEVFLLVQRGRAALRRGRLREAQECFDRVLEVHPAHRAALEGLGEVHARGNDHARACEFLERALEAGERTEHLLYLVANACRGAQRRDRALRYLAELVELNPGHVRGLTRLGEAYLERKDFERAREHFSRALELESHNIFALRGLASAQRGRRKYREAIPVWEELVRLDPQDHRALVRLGEAYAHEGDRANARRAYELALRIDPENRYARDGLAALSV